MEQKTRWAICGLGKISRRFLKVARSLKNVEIVACVSSSKERAIAYQKKYGIKYAFTYRELTDNATVVDAVYVCSHTSMHRANAEMFLKAKIPVLCEKAFSSSRQNAAEMIECAKANNTLLMEAMWTRFLPATQYAEKIAKSGDLGKIKKLVGWFWAGIGHGPKSRVFWKETSGGSILDLGVYLAHYSNMLLGSPDNIKAEGKVIHDVDRYCNFTLTYKDGAVAQLGSSFRFLNIREGFTIFLEKGTVKIPRFFAGNRVIVKPDGGQKRVERFEKRDGFAYEIMHFGDLIKQGKKQSPVMTFDTTLSIMSVLDELNRQLGVDFGQ